MLLPRKAHQVLIYHPCQSLTLHGRQLLTSSDDFAEWTPSRINATKNGTSKMELKRVVTNGAALIAIRTADHDAQGKPFDSFIDPRLPANTIEDLQENEDKPAALFIDPRLLTSAIDIEDMEEIGAEPGFIPAIQEVYFDSIVSPPVETGTDKLRIKGVDFVRFFSRINISRHQTLAAFGHHTIKADLIASVYSGNSRDEVSMWQFPCENAKFGCPYHHQFHSYLLEHQRACKITSLEAFAKLNKVKAFVCDRDGCDKSFDYRAYSLRTSGSSTNGNLVPATRAIVMVLMSFKQEASFPCMAGSFTLLSRQQSVNT